MSPVAEMDFKRYLTLTNLNRDQLRSFFGCLATALDFLHSKKVRHKDIKPGNILVDRGKIYFTDFGLAFDFTDEEGSTTYGTADSGTRKYFSPEVANYGPRNTKSDIWSLGVVFLEMVTVLKGKSLVYMNDYFQHHGNRARFIHANMDALPKFSKELRRVGDTLDNKALVWIEKMLVVDKEKRPSASALVTLITGAKKGEKRTELCGRCCTHPEDDDDSNSSS